MSRPDSPPVVLVVEDEMVLRMRAVDIVEDAGFVPIEAVSADEAIKILESRDDISLLFTHSNAGKHGRAEARACGALALARISRSFWFRADCSVGRDKPNDSKFFPKPLESE